MRAPETKHLFTEQIVGELQQIGYNVFYDVFKVRHYGVPQTRRRFVFIGFREAASLDYFLPQPGAIPYGIVETFHATSLPLHATIREFLYDLAQGNRTYALYKLTPICINGILTFQVRKGRMCSRVSTYAHTPKVA